MANKIDLTQAKELFPGAWEAMVEGLDPEEVEDMLASHAEDEDELWVHDGTLYSRTWWTSFGWHYGAFSQAAGWYCPDTGEDVCPWGED